MKYLAKEEIEEISHFFEAYKSVTEDKMVKREGIDI
jgi:hypothetical protein